MAKIKKFKKLVHLINIYFVFTACQKLLQALGRQKGTIQKKKSHSKKRYIIVGDANNKEKK